MSENVGRFFQLIEEFHDQEKVAQLQTALLEKDDQLQQEDEQIKALLSSWSWRITAPLRWLYEKVMVWKSPK